MTGNTAAINIKVILLILALSISIGTLYYSQSLVQQLQTREREIAELYAKSLEYIANSNEMPSDYTFIFDNIIKRIYFPVIITDKDDQANISQVGGGIRNLHIDSTLSQEETAHFIASKVKEFSQTHEPILVYLNSKVWRKIYYGDSDLVQSLRYYPYLQIVIAFFFVLIAYTSFSYLKKNEQNKIWVGMSKETAHQLGTPISSLMGWNEMLKLHKNVPDKVEDATNEIDSDLNRLKKIAERFSKIGSNPELQNENVYELISRVLEYFRKRLPQTGKKVSLSVEGEKEIFAKLNPELFEWVIENLIKNALDAIDNKEGIIQFRLTKAHKHIEIEVEDNGKGIDMKRRKDIFRPGYSTKRRGWGLGLSLSKRIIENYHKGKIFLKQSVLNEGTVFKITLNTP
jgi:anti-sigma regulatory factor (Ser/Thr protein kinase)